MKPTMPRRTKIKQNHTAPIWKRFENLIAKIQRDTAPGATVQNNITVAGKSGRQRQLDIVISQKIGLYPVMIVIECKRYKRPVSIEKVEAFASKIRDVRASQGVMVSASGFDAGAKAAAKENLIRLLTYREAETLDWRVVTADDFWSAFIMTDFQDLTIKGTTIEGDEVDLMPADKLTGSDRSEQIALADLFRRSREGITEAQMVVGPFSLELEFDNPLLLERDPKCRVRRVVFRGKGESRAYPLNLELAGGHVLEDAATGAPMLRQVITQGVDWQKVISSQEGQTLTHQDVKVMLSRENSALVAIDTRSLKRYIRLVLTVGEPKAAGASPDTS